MRKNSVRKWLHAILDLLPLFVIPIFAIYTRNENYNSNIELQVQENKIVEFNQQVVNGNFIDTSTWLNARLNFSVNDNTAILTPTSNSTTDNYLQYSLNMEVGHKYLTSFDYYAYNTNINTFTVFYGTTTTFTLFKSIKANEWDKGYIFFTPTDTQYNNIRLNNPNNNINNIMYFKNVMIFDLTTIYGSGNEPTSYNTFLTYFPNDYYVYQLNTPMLIEDYTTTYNDTDVGSQFVYTLYNTTDKYFNCSNLFNLEQVWNWVQLNLFGGNAPLMVYVVWQVIVYEFFMDLIFLLYSVFMFIIDFAENCLERPFDKIRRL